MDFEMVRKPKYIEEAIMNKELQAAYEQKEKERKEAEKKTLRDMFAMTAMGGYLQQHFVGETEDDYIDGIAKLSFKMADEMLRVREL